jgi:hypothetical protein
MSIRLSREQEILAIGLLSLAVLGGAAVLWTYSGDSTQPPPPTCVPCTDDTPCAKLACNTKCTCFGCEVHRRPCCEVCDGHAYCGCKDTVGLSCSCGCTCQELQPQLQPNLCTCS